MLLSVAHEGPVTRTNKSLMRSKLLDLLRTTRCARYVGKSASLSTKQLIPEPLPSSFPICSPLVSLMSFNFLYYFSIQFRIKCAAPANIHTHPMGGHSRQTGIPRGVGAVVQIKKTSKSRVWVFSRATQSIPLLKIGAKCTQKYCYFPKMGSVTYNTKGICQAVPKLHKTWHLFNMVSYDKSQSMSSEHTDHEH